MKKFLPYYFIFNIIIFAIIYVFESIFNYTHFGTKIYLTAIFLSIINFVAVWLTIRNPENKQTIVAKIMSAITLRFFSCLIFVVCYALLSPQKDKQYLIAFFILYLFFTVFEILYLITKLHSEK